MKQFLFIVALLISAETRAADLISCQTFADDAKSTLRVFQIDSGYAFEVELRPIFFSHTQYFHTAGAIGRIYAGTTPTLNFENNDVAISHIFGQREFRTRDGSQVIQFPDSDCQFGAGF